MARRTDQRRAAIWALYQSDLLDRPLDQTFTRDVHTFTRVLATEVKQHQPELDALISQYANGWTLARIAPLERSILRVGLLELTRPELLPGETKLPAEGAINEAVETAKQFCGADAPGFVNGILGAALRDRQAEVETAEVETVDVETLEAETVDVETLEAETAEVETADVETAAVQSAEGQR